MIQQLISLFQQLEYNIPVINLETWGVEGRGRLLGGQAGNCSGDRFLCKGRKVSWVKPVHPDPLLTVGGWVWKRRAFCLQWEVGEHKRV